MILKFFKGIFCYLLLIISIYAEEVFQPGDEYRGVVEKKQTMENEEGVEEVTVSIDPSDVIRPATSWLLGFNHSLIDSPKIALQHDNTGPWEGDGFIFEPSPSGQALVVEIKPEELAGNPAIHSLVKAKLPIELIRGKNVVISGKVKAELSSELKKGSGPKLQILTGNKNSGCIHIGGPLSGITNKWNDFILTGIIPEDASYASIYIGAQAASGKVYFDSVSVRDDSGKIIFSDDFNGYFFVDPTALSEEFLSLLRGMPLPLNRFGGTDSQWFHWKMSIGPYEKRTPHAINYYQPDKKTRPRLGFIEYIKYVRGVDSKAVFTFTLNMMRETPEDAADLAQFLCLDGISSDAPELAKKRVALGVEKPVDVAIWELGNELDVHLLSGYLPVDEYIARSKDFISHIRAVVPDAKFAVLAATAPWAEWYKDKPWRDWHLKVLKELGPEIDYIAFHPYFGTEDSLPKMSKYLKILEEDIRTVTGSNRIKIYNSEYAKWPVEEKGKPWKETWYKTHSLTGCLETADWLVRVYRDPAIGAQAYHCFSSGPWGIIYYDQAKRKLYTTGLADLFKLFYKSLGTEVVRSSFKCAGKDTGRFSVLAMKRPEGMSIVLVNREEKLSRDIHFTFADGAYVMTKAESLTADKLDDHNTVDLKKIRIVEEPVTEVSSFINYKMKPKSISFLQLERRKVRP